MTDYDNIIDDLYTKRYDYFIECANNVLKLIKRQDLRYELVNDGYFHIKENVDKLKDLIDAGQLEACVVRWMTMQVKWNNSKFKKAWVYAHKIESEKLLENLESYVIIDETISEEELYQDELDKQSKLDHIHNYVNNLSLDQKFLYENIFNRNINTATKLSRYIKLSRTSCYHMIKNLKLGIKNNYKK